MAVRAMENETYEPNTNQRHGNVASFVGTLILVLVFIFAVAYGAKWTYNWWTGSESTSVITDTLQKVTDTGKVPASVAGEPKPGYRRYMTANGSVDVKMCTAESADCGSIAIGKPANYGTGTHVSADGRSRPNPPAGLWHGQIVYQECHGGGLSAIQYNPDGIKELQSCDD
jgi:hypothetical protein